MSPPNRSAAAMPKVPLTNLQLELLKLYSTDVTTEELHQVRLLLGRHFGKKAIQGADSAWEERGLTDEDMDAWLYE